MGRGTAETMNRKILSWWMWGAAAATLVFLVAIVILLKLGSVSFDRDERWKALILLIPFSMALLFVAIGFWRAATNSTSKFERSLRWTLFAAYVVFLGSICTALGIFVMKG
jgi:hypothetical protein